MARSRPTDATEAQRQRILDAAEVALRRHGPSKTNVVDVARELGQTHASVYRYFTSKADLIDALVERWLHAVLVPLEAIARDPGPAPDRLGAWLRTLMRLKIRKVRDDPELFATFHAIAIRSDELVARHLAALVGQIEAILAEGVTSGAFQITDLHRAASAVQAASLRFHHPALLAAPNPLPTDDEANQVIALLIAGLRAGVV